MLSDPRIRDEPSATLGDGASRQRLKVLLTEGSSISSRQMLYELGPLHTIDVLDPLRLCQCRFSQFVRRWYRCPSFTQDPCGFLRFLAQRLQSEKYDVLLPPHDEVYLLSRVRETLGHRVAVAIPEFTAVEMLQSKLQFLELLRELQLPHPQTEVLTERRDIDRWNDFPRFVKLEFGTAGQGVRLVHDRRELQAALGQFQRHGWWSAGMPVLLQRPVAGLQGVVRGMFRHGRMVGSHTGTLRLKGVGGAAVARLSVDHAVAKEHLRRLGERLDWHGVIFADYFYDEATGVPQYIEADPRIGDAASAALSGAKLSLQWLDVALDREPAAPSDASPGIRTHAAILILLSRALDGAGRRDIWREMRAARRGTGIYENSLDEMTRPRDDWMSALPYAYVAARLLLRPAAAQRLVRGAVQNYALSAEAAARIRDIPQQQLESCFL